MSFVVRVDFVRVAEVRWLMGPRLGGMRAFAQREMAAIFETREIAQDAADEMLRSFQTQSATFTVEATDGSASGGGFN
ncbi:MAG TPA: hypothetical protein VFG04_30920 [Planctomycetaceae bacterium]|jgi:hypothetical protein|nr:hypothetical protein [Planctomycetaceae bacterium]